MLSNNYAEVKIVQTLWLNLYKILQKYIHLKRHKADEWLLENWGQGREEREGEMGIKKL